MSLTNATITYEKSGDWIRELTTTPTGLNDPSIVEQWKPHRHFAVSLSNGRISNGGTETATVEVVDGLEVARGTSPKNAAVLDCGGDVKLSVDGNETVKNLTNGSVEFDLTTDKSAGTEIEIVAESLADYPAESDSATIEVVSQ
jgi:hypothetical protein